MKKERLASKFSGRKRKGKINGLSVSLAKKYRKLIKVIESYKSALVAVSGGVDSGLLLAVARDVLGESLRAVIFTGPIFLDEEIKGAEKLCRKFKVEYEKLPFNFLEKEEFKKNAPDRCYHCKLAMFSLAKELAGNLNLEQVMEGSNLDDDLDYRPGKKALEELGIRSPLRESGFRKKDIRVLARYLGLPNWNMPSRACLASRIPYHEPVELERLQRIADAEKFLLKSGFTQVRVRDHGQIARLEVLPAELFRFNSLSLRKTVSKYLHKLGWKFVALDLEGYRTGSLNPERNTGRIKK